MDRVIYEIEGQGIQLETPIHPPPTYSAQRKKMNSRTLKSIIIIPHAMSCGGYDVFGPSVSPVFLVSATPLKLRNRIFWNFVVMKDIMCRWAYPQEILIQFFFSELHRFELRNLAKMKDTTETVCLPNSSETAEKNFLKLCSCEGHTM